MSLENSLYQWRQVVGSDRVGSRPRTTGEGSVPVITPEFVEQVRKCIQVSNETGTPLYPISTGRNWGYGGADPVTSDSVILDLSNLTKIEVIDKDSGFFSVEPGVTQGMLSRFLSGEGLEFMVPVHGGGPDCSVLGNALERGFGLTPTTDHFASLRCVEAVLADGSFYRSAFSSMGLRGLGAAHKWGVGPYIDGIFSQGNFAVVTRGVIALEPIPEHTEVFFFRMSSLSEMRECIPKLKNLLEALGSFITGVNLMNDRRILSMTVPYPIKDVPKGGTMSRSLCNSLCKSEDISEWTGVGVLHCPKDLVRGIRRKISRVFSWRQNRLIFINHGRLSLIKIAPVPVRNYFSLSAKKLESVRMLLDIASGIPSTVALPLAYWLRGGEVDHRAMTDPGRDKCGLIWYSPLVLAHGIEVENFVAMVERVCLEHSIEPLITLTSISAKHFDSTVPLLYDAEKPEEIRRAKSCYDRLMVEGEKIGAFPYRVGNTSMEKLLEFGDDTHWQIVRKLKSALDPNDILSPGRYSFTKRTLA